MADKLRELTHRFRAARADGRLRLPWDWEKPMPYRVFYSPSKGCITVTDPYPASRDPNEGNRHRDKPPMSTRVRRGLQAIDQWLELPDLARKVLIKGGKIVGTGVTAVGVCRIGYFELKRLREQDGSEPFRDGYEHARASVLSYIQGQPCQDPSATFIQSIKDLCNPFYSYKKPANEEPTKSPTKKPVEGKSTRDIEETAAAAKAKRFSEFQRQKLDRLEHSKRKGDKDKDKDKEKSQSKGSAAGQGPEAAPKK